MKNKFTAEKLNSIIKQHKTLDYIIEELLKDERFYVNEKLIFFHDNSLDLIKDNFDIHFDLIVGSKEELLEHASESGMDCSTMEEALDSYGAHVTAKEDHTIDCIYYQDDGESVETLYYIMSTFFHNWFMKLMSQVDNPHWFHGIFFDKLLFAFIFDDHEIGQWVDEIVEEKSFGMANEEELSLEGMEKINRDIVRGIKERYKKRYEISEGLINLYFNVHNQYQEIMNRFSHEESE